jgi:hypothetical protein
MNPPTPPAQPTTGPCYVNARRKPEAAVYQIRTLSSAEVKLLSRLTRNPACVNIANDVGAIFAGECSSVITCRRKLRRGSLTVRLTVGDKEPLVTGEAFFGGAGVLPSAM